LLGVKGREQDGIASRGKPSPVCRVIMSEFYLRIVAFDEFMGEEIDG
jgi:hypothetical protein